MELEQVMEEWENMLHFAIEMIIHSNEHKVGDIINQRISIIHLDHATELLMKSFLLKKDYLINEIDLNKVKGGLKNNLKINVLLHKDKTIGFNDVLDIVSKLVKLDKEDKEKIIKFHKIRNEIQHRALIIPMNKQEEIAIFSPALKNLYNKMFPEFIDAFPSF